MPSCTARDISSTLAWQQPGLPRRAPTVAYTVDGHRSVELAGRLAEFKLGVEVGHFYAYRLIEALDSLL